MNLRKSLLSIFLTLAIALPTAFGVIVPGGRAANGTLDNSGTNKNPAPVNLGSYTGVVDGGFLGTAIGPKYLITATHIGLQSSFVYSDGTGTPATYNIALAGRVNDLSIYSLQGPETFSHWAPLYTSNNEVGKSLVVIGNGTTRGNPVISPITSNLAGWEWGGTNTLRSWGTNTVDSVVVLNQSPPFQGDFLYFKFSNPGNPDNAMLSGGDSGGPTFVLDPSDNVWKLAGINGGVDGVSQTSNGPFYPAALFDSRGFFDENGNLISGPDPVPLGNYVSRISNNADFIYGIIAVPEPGSLALFAVVVVPGVYVVIRRRRKASDAWLMQD